GRGGAVMDSGASAYKRGPAISPRPNAADTGSLDRALRREIVTCRSIAKQCAFVIGPARSGTTILAQLINAHARAFLTTEANFYLAGAYPDFRQWYNLQHRTFGNQVSKSSYAPHLCAPGERAWWQWLSSAACHFELVGDKMAYTNVHIRRCLSGEFMSFFESRFFESRYMSVFRDPVQTVLSSAVLWNKEPRSLVSSWASVVKLWADFIRIFPYTTTILHAELNESKIDEIGQFLGLDLSE